MVTRSDDDVIDPKGSRPRFRTSNSRRRLKDTIEDDVEHKHTAETPFRASNSRKRIKLDNSED